jgi:hypothetical protein
VPFAEVRRGGPYRRHLGRKPAPTMLFDECEHTNDAHKKQAENLYEFLNRCARPEWEAVRRETERWYAEFPEPKRDLLRRFRKKEVDQHLPAWWELYVHRLFACLGYDIEVHPQLPGREEKPTSSSAAEPRACTWRRRLRLTATTW